MTQHPSLAAHLLPLLLLVVAPPARADWHSGSGILLNLPPICLNISDPACIDVALQPISGVVFGLATPFSQYPGGGLAVLLLDNAVCNVWWDKGHNEASFRAAGTAAAAVRADGSFVFPRGWDSGWPFPDATSPRFAAFAVNLDFPASPTGLVGGVNYVNENMPIGDEIFTGAYTWAFADRSACTDPNQLCAAATWFPPHPPVDPVTPGTCPAPPGLPVALMSGCAGCAAPAAAPVEVVPRTTLERLAGVALGAQTLAAGPTASPSPTATASATPSTSASPSASVSTTATQAAAPTLPSPSPSASGSASGSASASASASSSASTPAAAPASASASSVSAFAEAGTGAAARSSGAASSTALSLLTAIAAVALAGARLI